MHPRNRYSKEPADFGELAEFRPTLRPYLIEKHGKRLDQEKMLLPSGPAHHNPAHFAYTLDFSDPNAVRELTCAVLEKDFGLKVELPVDRLIPTIPQKLNYIHWVEDLLTYGGVAIKEEGVAIKEEGVASEALIPKGRSVIGIDIGTGVSCIYPLLGSSLNDWTFIATDISTATIQCAMANVSRNNLEDHIKVKLVSADSMLKEVMDPAITQYSFTVCNPPFFKSEEERLGGSHHSQRPLPSTYSIGTVRETVTAGGEVKFVLRMIEDSLELRNRIRWYTSMLGKKASLKEIVSKLKTYQVPVVTATEFVQGKTWRWAVAWSFDTSLKEKVEEAEKIKRSRKRGRSHTSLQLVVKGIDNSAPDPSPAGIQEVMKWLEDQLDKLEISRIRSSDSSDADGVVRMSFAASRVTWTHQRKRRRLLERLNAQSPHANQGAYEEKNEGTSKASLLDIELEKKTTAEIESLCTPCRMEFTCCVKLATPENLSQKKKKKESDPEGVEGLERICVELDWIDGDDGGKDLLHQLLQYLQNQMLSKSFL